MVRKFYDTNALLNLGEKLFDDDEKFYVSQISLQELENIKTNRHKDDDIKARARNVVRLLNANPDKYEFVPYGNGVKSTVEGFGLTETPDNMICASAHCAQNMLRYGGYGSESDSILFITADLCCKLIAENIFELDVEDCTDSEENIYKGYKVISGTSDDINKAMELIYETQFDGWYINEYLLIQNSDDGSEKEMRFDGTQFVPLKLPTSKYVKAKNSLQRCALDILNNQDITIAAILGGYGSGKTFLSTKMALYNVLEKGNQSQILYVREPIGEGREEGYLPGTFEDKHSPFDKVISQQLDGGEFELESLKQRGVFESNIPYYMKGNTYNNTAILVDEAEDLSEKQIRLIGTRIGDNSKIILNGDYKQSVINVSDNNALVKMCNAFKGNKMFGCIYLGEDVRSSTSKMFASLFEY